MFICSFVVFHDEAKRTQQGDLLGFISLAGPSFHLIITMGWNVVSFSTPAEVHPSLAGLLIMVVVNGTAGRKLK